MARIYRKIFNIKEKDPNKIKNILEDDEDEYIDIGEIKRMCKHIKLNKVETKYNTKDISLIDYNISVEMPEKYKSIDTVFKSLLNQPQYEQKSKEWYEIRDNMITASDVGSICGVNHYTSSKEVMKRKLGYTKFEGSEATSHGNRYEKIATLLYSHINNSKVQQFGLLQGDVYKFLGASPDGIIDKYTLDDTFNPLYGRMIEIKCPFKRQLTTEGKICGNMIPTYYYYQVQQQLEICHLDECDFIQCEIVEIDKEEFYYLDYLGDKRKIKLVKIDSKGNQKEEYLEPLYCKGLILENTKENFKYIHPPNLELTLKDYLNFLTVNQKADYQVKYWKLNFMTIITLKRDKEWITINYNTLKKFFDEMIYYRKNKREFEEVYDIKTVDKKK